ncbi:MAG: YbaB/EbfC family nucleoid-associated protein [Planctomycetota bacterium]
MDIQQMMQALGPLRERVQQAEADRAEARIEGSAGGGAVTVVLKGDLSVERVRIAPAAAAAADDDATMLEDLIAGAMANALDAYKQRYGASPEEQLQKSLGDGDMMSLLGGMFGTQGG